MIAKSLIHVDCFSSDFIMRMIEVTRDVVGVSLGFGEGEFVRFLVGRGGVEALRLHEL